MIEPSFKGWKGVLYLIHNELTCSLLRARFTYYGGVVALWWYFRWCSVTIGHVWVIPYLYAYFSNSFAALLVVGCYWALWVIGYLNLIFMWSRWVLRDGDYQQSYQKRKGQLTA